jgi:hypothetical protein
MCGGSIRINHNVGVKKERKRRLVKRKKTEHKEEKTKKQKE